jgi:hypothetical protein
MMGRVDMTLHALLKDRNAVEQITGADPTPAFIIGLSQSHQLQAPRSER